MRLDVLKPSLTSSYKILLLHSVFCVKNTHVHAHVPGLPLAQVLFRSNNLKTAEHILALLPEGLDVLFVVNLLSREPKLMTENSHKVQKIS